MLKNGLKFFGVVVFILWLSGCTHSGKDDKVSLNITGVDYAGTGIDVYDVEDPKNPKNHGGGFSITPYSADGIQCCFTVPKEWHPGLKVNVLIRYPLEGETGDEISASLVKRQAEGTLVDTVPAEIPKYKTPARGTLWVQFMPNKKVKLVVSDLDPSHKDFPGEVKGWPVPSDEYRRKLIDQKIHEINSRIELNSEGLTDLNKSPKKTLEMFWRIFKKTNSLNESEFSGPYDEKFKKHVENYLREYIKNDKIRLEKLKEIRP